MSYLLLLMLAAGPAHAPVKMTEPVQDKNFYLLSLIENTPAAKEAVAKDATLSGLHPGLQFTDEQMATAAHALGALYSSSAPVRRMTDGPLRASGMYIRYDGLAGGELLERALTDCMKGMNRMADVYGAGKAPRYPAIDAATYDTKSAAWRAVLKGLAALMDDEKAQFTFFFSEPLKYALEVMWLNHRDEAGRHEPMEERDNGAAFRHAKTVNWAKYPYSVIVVPGAGSDRPGVRLSPGGKLRDEIAAKRFLEGKAPFVLVSGGYVHPIRTEYSEAIEMKRDLMERFHIPEKAIIVDPHARHTTTNMRNAARLIYRYGIPFDKKALVTSDPNQSAYITNATFDQRCMDELGYMPYRIVARISAFDVEFLPKIESLQADATDPLDP